VNQVWKEVTRQFVDRSFNGLQEEGWRQKRLDAVTKVSNMNLGPGNEEKVYAVIRNQ
jgi:hypothetical protein